MNRGISHVYIVSEYLVSTVIFELYIYIRSSFSELFKSWTNKVSNLSVYFPPIMLNLLLMCYLS